MPVPSSIADLSSTASSNYPSGSESIGTSLDDYLRAHASIIRQVSDAKADSSTAVTLTGTQTLQNKTLDGTNSLSGDLSLTGTGARITGDFSNATVANRVMFQTSTVNGSTSVGVIPNGTNTQADLLAANSADINNASALVARASATEITMRSAVTGTGTYLPMTFYTGGSERMRIDTNGNVGIGATPAASQGSFQSYITISGGAPAASGAADANQMAAIKGGSIQLSFGAYASGNVWLQPRSSSNFATNLDLYLNPNGGNVVVPAGKLSSVQAAKAWVSFNGSTGAIRSSHGVASVTRTGTGTYTVAWSAGVLADGNYAAVMTCSRSSATGVASQNEAVSQTSTQIGVICFQNGGVAYDPAVVNVMVFGN